MPGKPRVEFTPAQLRALHTALSVALNDPEWTDVIGLTGREVRALHAAHDVLTAAVRELGSSTR